MYEYGFKSFAIETVIKEGPLSINVDGIKNKQFFVKTPLYFHYQKRKKMRFDLSLNSLQNEKLAKATEGHVGNAILYLRDEPVRKVPIYIKKRLKKSENWWQKLQKRFF